MLSNIVVLKSNVASRPILKKPHTTLCPPNLSNGFGHAGFSWYETEPADPRMLEEPYVTTPHIRDDTFRSVYGFSIPDPIRLRIMALKSPRDEARYKPDTFINTIQGLGHGIEMLIDRDEAQVDITHDSKSNRLAWQVKGIGVLPMFDNVPIFIHAPNIPGHAPRFYEQEARASISLAE